MKRYLVNVLATVVIGGFSSPVLAQPVTKPPIRIAVLDALSGPYAAYGTPTVIAARYVFGRINKAGGLNGRELQIITEDDGCSPRQAVGGATKLASDKTIMAVLGLTCSGASVAVHDAVASTLPFPLLSFSAGGWTSSSPELGGLKRNFYFITPPAYVQAGAMVNYMANELKAKRVAFIGQTDVYGKEGLKGVTDMLAKYGITLVANETAEPRAADMTPQLLKIKAASPDALLAFLYEIPAQTLLRQANELGIRPSVVVSGAIVNNSTVYGALPPEAVAKLISTTVLKDSFRSPAFAGTLKELQDQNPGVELNWLTLLAVAGAETLVEAISKAGDDVTADRIIAELDNLQGFQTSTLAYPVTFTPNNHAGAAGMHFNTVVDGSESSAMTGYWSGWEPARTAVSP